LAGHESLLFCEIDPGARAVLQARFPGVPCHEDIRALRHLPKDTDLLAAGFPCQDLSQAGMTAGLAGEKSGLVGNVFRLLRKQRVPWVLLENVPFMLQLAGGRALHVIIESLERLGYRWAYRIVDSLAFGVPQRRERVFLLASLDEDPRPVLLGQDAGAPAHTAPSEELSFGFYWTEGTRGLGAAVDSVPTLKGGSTIGIPSPPGVLLPAGAIVTPTIEDAERLQGFDPEWTSPAENVGRRSARWKLVGNAVTIPVAAWIGARLADAAVYDASWDAPLPLGRWPSAAWNEGKGRHAAVVSTWPKALPRPHLHEFLERPVPLSLKATEGFWRRLQSSRLRRPRWFDEGVVRHILQMRRSTGSSSAQDYSSEGADGGDSIAEASATY
jgi:DNA (cytosine-5)-methyltransferase 1